MCGIIGYRGPRNVISILTEGLRRLEYRGYDSTGVAYFSEKGLERVRSMGKLFTLEERLSHKRSAGCIGIGHTRWATHGVPSEINAHPHQAGSVVLVHNGIVENYLPLKKELQARGRTFLSDTDSEVLAHLIDDSYQRGNPLDQAVLEAMSKVRGSYAVCLISEKEPDRMIAIRSGCPLVLGISETECFVASDIPAFLPYTREVVYLQDGEMALIGKETLVLQNIHKAHLPLKRHTIQWTAGMAEKGGFRHFMAKEIYEQPEALRNTMRNRIVEGEVTLEERLPKKIDRIVFIACGTSWHAALIGKFLIEDFAALPVEVDIASEFRYRSLHLAPSDLVIPISQSGETADTLAGLREAKKQGAATLAICNTVGSTISREGPVLYTHAGPEISVASTKAFTTQITALLLLALHLGQKRGLPEDKRKDAIANLLRLPEQIEAVLKLEEQIASLAMRFFRYEHFIYLGRGLHYPVALEGALKLKEISYIHAEGYPAGEMKHGPIALIDENMPVVFLAPRDHLYEKAMSNMMEVKARGGKILLFTDDREALPVDVDAMIPLPTLPPYLSPIVTSVPLQLLAYHMAVLRGNDVDQPRNLAKSVTVE